MTLYRGPKDAQKRRMRRCESMKQKPLYASPTLVSSDRRYDYGHGKTLEKRDGLQVPQMAKAVMAVRGQNGVV